MDDLLYLAIGIGLFAISALFVRGKRGASSPEDAPSPAETVPPDPERTARDVP